MAVTVAEAFAVSANCRRLVIKSTAFANVFRIAPGARADRMAVVVIAASVRHRMYATIIQAFVDVLPTAPMPNAASIRFAVFPVVYATTHWYV